MEEGVKEEIERNEELREEVFKPSFRYAIVKSRDKEGKEILVRLRKNKPDENKT